MKIFRAAVRLLALCVTTLGYYLCWIVGLPFVFAFPGLARSWRSRNFGGWARTSARIVGMRVDVRNAPPAPPFLLVSNHLSYADIVVLESEVDCAFVAKKELAGWPILGFIARTLNTIFIDRGRKRDILRAMTKAEATLKRGLGVVLFAEGTSTAGHNILPFKSSLLEFAARRQMPVHYACISYVVPPGEGPAEQSVCWWGDMSFPRHLFRLLKLPSFEARVVFGPQPIVSDDRHLLASKLWSAVSAHFIPIRSIVQNSPLIEQQSRQGG